MSSSSSYHGVVPAHTERKLMQPPPRYPARSHQAYTQQYPPFLRPPPRQPHPYPATSYPTREPVGPHGQTRNGYYHHDQYMGYPQMNYRPIAHPEHPGQPTYRRPNDEHLPHPPAFALPPPMFQTPNVPSFYAPSQSFPFSASSFHVPQHYHPATTFNAYQIGWPMGPEQKKSRRSKRRNGRFSRDFSLTPVTGRNQVPAPASPRDVSSTSLFQSTPRRRTKSLPSIHFEYHVPVWSCTEDHRVTDWTSGTTAIDTNGSNSKKGKEPIRPFVVKPRHQTDIELDLELSLFGLLPPFYESTFKMSRHQEEEKVHFDLVDRANLIAKLHEEIDEFYNHDETPMCLRWIDDTFYDVEERLLRLKKFNWLDLSSSVLHEALFAAAAAMILPPKMGIDAVRLP